MYIKTARVRDYSSILDSGEVCLEAGVNLIIGPNNSGKSAFLRALVPPLLDNPTRISSTQVLTARSTTTLTLAISPNELFYRNREQDLAFPFNGSDPNGQNKLDSILAHPDLNVMLDVVRIGGNNCTTSSLGGSIEELRDLSNPTVVIVRKDINDFTIHGRNSGHDSLPSLLDNPLTECMFYFNAQRVNVGRIAITDEILLKPDASNLPTVLSNVQNTKPATFEQIERHLAEIIPGIERITVVQSGGALEIFLWPERTGTLNDVRFSLNESGSGVAQLLAILTAIVLHRQAVIVIDEINTYLHPAAVKKLMRIIQSNYAQHQYIISCHSPDVIFSVSTANLLSVHREGLLSSLRKVELRTAEDARRVSGMLGFSMLDVFGNDRIIWVEGPTEEVLFPFLLEKRGTPLAPEFGIAAVGTTSGFDGGETRRKEVLAIYENAGKRLAPLLQGMAFGLDRESMTDDSVKQIENSRKKLRFLPRRCVENYFLNAEAIATVMGNLGEDIAADVIREELLRVAKESRFRANSPRQGIYNSKTWLRWVDGAKLLSHIFSMLSETRIEFRKTRDVQTLAEALLATDAGHLDELVAYITNLVKIAARDTKP